MTDDSMVLEQQINQWRAYAQRHRQLHSGDLDELEDHLRTTVSELTASGLHPDEAFLVAVKRMGNLNELSREFSRAHSERLWKQLVLADQPDLQRDPESRRAWLGALGVAAAAALAIKVPALFGANFTDRVEFYARNMPFFTLGPLVAYFAWQRRVSPRVMVVLAAMLAIGCVAINAYPFTNDSDTKILASLHLTLALWLVVGVAYVGGDWRNAQRRMDFIRFTGEILIYAVLIGLGGGVLIGVLNGTFSAININTEKLIGDWIVPCGLVGALVIAAWLVEAKQGVIENMAPVLTRLFTPLFAGLLVALLVAFVLSKRGFDIERDVLIIFNVVLVIVLGLLLYTLSARPPDAPPGLFDRIQLALVYSALVIDVIVLIAIFGRTSDSYGFTANRTAALGQNVVLLANLAWSAYLLGRFLVAKTPFGKLERWQTNYLPVYGIWAWFVVLAFPLIFSFK